MLFGVFWGDEKWMYRNKVCLFIYSYPLFSLLHIYSNPLLDQNGMKRVICLQSKWQYQDVVLLTTCHILERLQQKAKSSFQGLHVEILLPCSQFTIWPIYWYEAMDGWDMTHTSYMRKIANSESGWWTHIVTLCRYGRDILWANVQRFSIISSLIACVSHVPAIHCFISIFGSFVYCYYRTITWSCLVSVKVV